MPRARQKHSAGRHIAAAAAATLLAVFTALAVTAGTASAGTYSVYSCAGPSGQSVSNSAWAARRSSQSLLSVILLDSSCPSLSVSAVGAVLGAGDNAGLAFDAPPNTAIAGYSVSRSISLSYVSLGSKPKLSAGLRRSAGGANSYAGECDAVTTNCSVSKSTVAAGGLSASSLQLGIECVQTTSCGSLGLNLMGTTMTSARVDLRDDVAPKLTLTGGDLPGATGTAGTRELSVAINDLGGGIKSYWVTVDGATKQAYNIGGSCGAIFTQPVPCPLDRKATFKVDLAAAGPGNHTAIAYAADAAGNVGQLAAVKFASGPLFSSNGTPAVSSPIVTTRALAIEGRGGKAVTIRGSVKTGAGAPIAGALLDVTATSVGGSATGTSLLGFTKTSSKGAFKFKVRPRGARYITFAFRPTSASKSTASASTLVRQRLSLSARRSKARLRRGQTLTISGKLSGAADSAAGAPVTIEVRNGRKWKVVGSATAASGGRYAWTYRFTKVSRPTLFTFRAVVRATGTWPWKTKASRNVKVLVRG